MSHLKKHIILAPFLDCIPNFMYESSTILCAVDQESKKIMDDNPEAFIRCVYYNYILLGDNVKEWTENIDILKKEILDLFNEKETILLFVFHPYFERSIDTLFEELQLPEEIFVYGNTYNSPEAEECVIFTPVSFEISGKGVRSN